MVGVVNVTPNSFSDGGHFLEASAAVDHALKLVGHGAEIIDIGGESTRPQAAPVAEAEELRRVMPVLERLSGKIGVPISIDTMKTGVAREALAAGASIVNDVAANRETEDMWELVAQSRAGYVCMHMQGSPATMQQNPTYNDVVREVETFFQERVNRLHGCGVRSEQIILDPGIGFGKKIEHNLKLLGALQRFARLDRPLLMGVSRKSFLAKVSGTGPDGRLAAGLACACVAVAAGVQFIRTHDVSETLQAVRMVEAILAERVE